MESGSENKQRREWVKERNQKARTRAEERDGFGSRTREGDGRED